jgi:hypothetical protein
MTQANQPADADADVDLKTSPGPIGPCRQIAWPG